jgi:hypothetical protein
MQRHLKRSGYGQRKAGLACGGVGMDSIAVVAVDWAAAAEDGGGLEARDALLVQHLADPAVAGLELAAAGFLAVGELHGHHADAAGTGQLQEGSQIRQPLPHAGIGVAGGLGNGSGAALRGLGGLGGMPWRGSR